MSDFDNIDLQAGLVKIRIAIRKYCKNSNDLDDLMQDTAVRALRARTLFKGDQDNLVRWLYIIAIRLYWTEYRKNKRRKTVCGSQLDKFDFDSAKPSRNLDEANTNFAGVWRSDLGIYESCWVLMLQGYTYKEISNITRIKLGTVMSRIHRARKILRREFFKTLIL